MNTTRPLQHRLMSLGDAAALIATGRPCTVAADQAMLERLPRGRWIGGTIPYFLSDRGGTCTRDEVFVTEMPLVAGAAPRIQRYDMQTLQNVCTDAPEHGFTLLIIPAFSAAHESFAELAPGYADMYLRPLVGWISGVHLDDIGKVRPMVFDGQTGRAETDVALAMHVRVPPTQLVHVDIINLFRQQPGPVIEFARGGFAASECTIDGMPRNLHDWMVATAYDTRLPLVADYCGALVNVSIKRLDGAARRVEFYAPVFAGSAYRPAEPVPDYVQAFDGALKTQQVPGQQVFSCNCILNYAYGGLEGRQVPLHGPATFGEIGYQLLNQTLVYLSLIDG